MIQLLDSTTTWQAICEAAGQAQRIQIGVAYITADQSEKLLPALKKAARKKAAAVSVLCGIGDMHAQSPVALQQLNNLAAQHPRTVAFGLVPPGRGLFHPKYYYFDDGVQADIFIGSSNLTSRAFGLNTECNIRLCVDVGDGIARDCRSTFDLWAGQAKVASDSVQDYVQIQSLYEEVLALEGQILQATEKFGQTLRGAAALPRDEVLLPTPQSRVADLLASGYIGSVDVPTSRFHITIDSHLTGRAEPTRRVAGNLEVKDQRVIRWSLLDKKDVEQLGKLRNGIAYEQREYVIHTPWGAYISGRMFKEWIRWVNQSDQAFKKFEEEAIAHLKGRQAEKMAEFKRDFYKLFPRATKTAADTIARQVKTKYQSLVKSHASHHSLLHPRWYSARPLAYPAPLPDGLGSDLHDFARTLTTIGNEQDLAAFAQAICKRACRYASTAFKAGSQKKTIEAALHHLDLLNFYRDIRLQQWAERVPKEELDTQ